MKRVNKILQNYWKGSTEVNEEEELKQYFGKKENIELEDVYFNYLENKRKEKLNAPGFDSEILRQVKNKELNIRPLFQRKVLQIAASIILLLALGVLLHKQRVDNSIPTGANQIVVMDTFDDPQLAFEETKKALLLISHNLNKGKEYTTELAKFNDTREKLQTN